jgi:uncharacterized protein YukE
VSQPSNPPDAGLIDTTRQTVGGLLDTLRDEIDAMPGGYEGSSGDAAMVRLSFETSAAGIDQALAELRRVLAGPGASPAAVEPTPDRSRADRTGLAQTYRRLTAALEDLEVGLRRLLDDSDDAARATYAQCKQGWDRYVANLADVLNQIGSAAVAAGHVPA